VGQSRGGQPVVGRQSRGLARVVREYFLDQLIFNLTPFSGHTHSRGQSPVFFVVVALERLQPLEKDILYRTISSTFKTTVYIILLH
jgi:hypothetical protein